MQITGGFSLFIFVLSSIFGLVRLQMSTDLFKQAMDKVQASQPAPGSWQSQSAECVALDLVMKNGGTPSYELRQLCPEAQLPAARP